MSETKTYTVKFRRKREGKTNYKKRLRILLADKPRLVIRKSLNSITLQIIEYHPEGDKVLISVHSNELNKLGWKANKGNLPAAYLSGLLMGKKAKQKKINKLVLDIGFNKSVKGSRIYAALKGVIDAGIDIPHSKDIFPTEERISGSHISKHALMMANQEGHKEAFSNYIKNNLSPKETENHFEEAKKKIMGVK